MKKHAIVAILALTTLSIAWTAEPVAWEVTNLTTWADAHYGITNGGDGKTYTIIISGNVTIPPTGGFFTNTFEGVKNITITMQGTGTIALSGNGCLLRIGNGQTVIVKNITLQGRDNTTSLVDVSTGGTFRMEGNAKVTGNTSTNSSGGGVRVTGGAFILQDEAAVSGNTASVGTGTATVNTEAQGGGVFLNGGSFIMRGNARVEGNTAIMSNSVTYANGGGVYVSAGTFTMESGSISNNTASGGKYGNARGGGVSVNGGTFTMESGSISNNTVTGNQAAWGGGVFGNFTMRNGTISGNSVSANNTGSSGVVEARGGGVSGNLIMQVGTISGNTVIAGRTYGNNSDVNAYGGGVYGQLTMNGGTISGNTVSASNNVNANRVIIKGGGVYTWSFSKTGGTIYGNQAADDLRNITVGGRGHAVYCVNFGAADNWRNAVAGPTNNSSRLDFWLNETDITYTVIHNTSLQTALVFTFSEDPGNLLSSHITLSDNVSRGNATVTGSGTTRTLSPVTVSGNGIITVSINTMYRVETGSKNIKIIPDAPTGITTVASASTVTLNWDPVYLATGYRVHRSTSASGTYALIGTTSSASYTDIRLSPNTTCFYRVTAINSAGESVVQAQVSATTLGTNTELAIAVSPDTIVIEWPREKALEIARDVALGINNIVFGIVGMVFDMSLHSYSYSYVIYRDEKIIDEIKIPLSFGVVPDSSKLDHFYVDNKGLEPSTTYSYRVAVKVSIDFGSLEGIIHKEEKDYVLKNAFVTTLSGGQR
jgi:hypothetical protein